MKALTICNPYPYMIMDHSKRVENRTWATSYRGPLLIHAGKNRDWLQDGDFSIYPDMQFGFLLGAVEIVDCMSLEEISRGDYPPALNWLPEHEHTLGPYCWVLGDKVRRLKSPVPWKGAQGLWQIDDSDVMKWEWLEVTYEHEQWREAK